jgi:hypothetical protein
MINFEFNSKGNSQKIILLLCIALAVMLLNAWIIQYLWNYALVPAIEGVKEIEFVQALCLKALFSSLTYADRVIGKDKK